MSDGVPQGWTTARLEEIVTKKKGKKPAVLRDTPAEGFVPYLDIHAIEKNVVREYAEVKSSKIASKDDLFVVWDGARSGWVGGGITGAIGSTIMALTAQTVESVYVRQFIASQFKNLNTNTRGTGIPHVDPEVFWNLEVPLAPLAEQRRIVAKLEKLLGQVDACQQRLEKLPTQLKRFRQSILAAACSGRLTVDWRLHQSESGNVQTDVLQLAQKQREEFRAECDGAQKDGRRKPRIPTCLDEEMKCEVPEEFPELPESWSYVTLGRLASNEPDSFVDGPFGSAVNTKTDYIDAGVPVVRINNVRPFQFVNENLKYVLQTKFDELSRHKISSGDILLAKVGATIGDCCIYPDGLPTALLSTTGSCRLTVERRLADNRFVCAQLNLRKPHLQWIASAVAQPFLNMATVKSLPFALPPLAEQQEIVRRVAGLFALADQLEQRLAQARKQVDKLTPSLLARAFAGKLVPKDPNDEPAERLLKRIKNSQNE